MKAVVIFLSRPCFLPIHRVLPLWGNYLDRPLHLVVQLVRIAYCVWVIIVRSTTAAGQSDHQAKYYYQIRFHFYLHKEHDDSLTAQFPTITTTIINSIKVNPFRFFIISLQNNKCEYEKCYRYSIHTLPILPNSICLSRKIF